MCNLSDAIEERGIKQGMERGMEKGKEWTMMELVCRKLLKGKSLSVIAEELEEEETAVQRIYEAALETAPDFDVKKVYEILHSKEKKLE